MPGISRIRRLPLTNFRSYRAAHLQVGSGPVVLVGANGAGKTNLLEAISFLAPGRGLRRATLEEVAFSEGDGGRAGAAELGGAGGWGGAAGSGGALGLVRGGPGMEPPAGEDAIPRRKCRIDREPVASAA